MVFEHSQERQRCVAIEGCVRNDLDVVAVELQARQWRQIGERVIMCEAEVIVINVPMTKET